MTGAVFFTATPCPCDDGDSSSDEAPLPIDSSSAPGSPHEEPNKEQFSQLQYRRVLLIARTGPPKDTTSDEALQQGRKSELILIFDPAVPGVENRIFPCPASIREIQEMIVGLGYADRWANVEDNSRPPSAELDLNNLPAGRSTESTEPADTQRPAEQIVGVASKVQTRLATSDGRPSQRSWSRTFLRLSETTGPDGKQHQDVQVEKLILKEGRRVSNILETIAVPDRPEKKPVSGESEADGASEQLR